LSPRFPGQRIGTLVRQPVSSSHGNNGQLVKALIPAAMGA
jgi:hypothetical protein